MKNERKDQADRRNAFLFFSDRKSAMIRALGFPAQLSSAESELWLGRGVLFFRQQQPAINSRTGWKAPRPLSAPLLTPSAPHNDAPAPGSGPRAPGPRHFWKSQGRPSLSTNSRGSHRGRPCRCLTEAALVQFIRYPWRRKTRLSHI